MKRILSFVISGFAGGIIVLAGLILLDDPSDQPLNQGTPYLASLSEMMTDAPSDFVAAAAEAMPAVVHISAAESIALARNRQQNRKSRDPFSFFFGGDGFFDGPRARSGKGSGVIISEDGYIVTNNHVIDYADEFEVTLYDNRKFRATLIGQDPRTDIAIIKVDASDLPFLKFGDSDEITVGEWVLAVGNPFDLTSTVTAGIVSAKGRDNIIRRSDAIEDFIQTDAVVNPGNSGGALVNTQGDLIGVNTAIATATGYYAGYSFAIPANMLQPIIDNIIEHGGPRGRLGVSIASIPEYEDYAEIDIALEKGAVITRIEDGGAAQYAGILPNDIITNVDGVEIDNPDKLIEVLSTKSIGDEVLLTISRDGQQEEILVILKAE